MTNIKHLTSYATMKLSQLMNGQATGYPFEKVQFVRFLVQVDGNAPLEPGPKSREINTTIRSHRFSG
jgi:hypothetical protein